VRPHLEKPLMKKIGLLEWLKVKALSTAKKRKKKVDYFVDRKAG
jgi:hypothetical protein